MKQEKDQAEGQGQRGLT